MVLIIECLAFALSLRRRKFSSEHVLYRGASGGVLLSVMLYMQTELFKKSALEKNLTMNLLWQQQSKDQYQLTREKVDLINRKCHDLKHQVQALRMMGNDDVREKYSKELEQSVQIYDAIETRQ